MQTFTQLKKHLKKDFTGHKAIKVAVLGDTATQFLIQALRGAGYERGFDLQVWEADFNQIERQLFDPSSELFQFKPEIVVVFHSTHIKPILLNKIAINRPIHIDCILDELRCVISTMGR